MHRVVGAGVHATMEQSSDDGGPAGRGPGDAREVPGGVYRTRLRSVLLAGVLTGILVRGCSSFSNHYPAFVWSRRIPSAVVLASVLVIRVLRRAVIVSPFGLEGRRTFVTWRVPWSVVESLAVGQLTVPVAARGS